MGRLCVGGRGVGFVRVAGGSDTCSEGTGLEVWLFLDGSDIFMIEEFFLPVNASR